MSAHLLKGIRPYNEEATDLLIVDGVIAALGAEAAQQAANYSDLKEHDFTGLVALPGLEIGRASCRERVCLYV